MKEESLADMKTPSPATDAGTGLGQVGRYALQERVGQGGFGI